MAAAVRFVKDFFRRVDKSYFNFKYPGEDSGEDSKDDRTKKRFSANAGLDKKSGLLFRTVTAEARVSLTKGPEIKQVNSDILTGYASATMGTYVGVEAGANLVELGASIFKLNLGYGVGTGMGIQDGSVVVKFLGTGIKLGRKIGVSVLGSAFELDFGMLLKKAGDACRFWVQKAVVDRVRHLVGLAVKVPVESINEGIESIKKKAKESINEVVKSIIEGVEFIKKTVKESINEVVELINEVVELIKKAANTGNIRQFALGQISIPGASGPGAAVQEESALKFQSVT